MSRMSRDVAIAGKDYQICWVVSVVATITSSIVYEYSVSLGFFDVTLQ